MATELTANTRRQGKSQRITKWMFWVTVLLFVYVWPYYVVSRGAMRAAKKMRSPGYYFVDPMNPDADETQISLRVFYYPLTQIDRMLGNMEPGTAPLRKFAPFTHQ